MNLQILIRRVFSFTLAIFLILSFTAAYALRLELPPVDLTDYNDMPVVSDATSAPTSTPMPTPTPVPVQYAANVWHIIPTDAQYAAMASHVRPDCQNGFLPVCYGANTNEKIVAITIDDCNQPGNLGTIISLLQKYNGKATIFPIGQNIQMCSDQLVYAYNNGFEIENHTWSHSGLYPDNDAEFCEQICRQNAAVSALLGTDVQMHFLRPRGGDNRYDQRTHAYIRQQGYYGIAYWTLVGAKVSTKSLLENTKPGDIFLFHTTDADLAQLNELIPALAKMGYRFVTLNELYGLPENERNDKLSSYMPEAVEPFSRIPQAFSKGDYLHDVYRIQERLTALGFLEAEYNGFYGDTTKSAVAAFQKSCGLEADGVCGSATWNKLFPEDMV